MKMRGVLIDHNLWHEMAGKVIRNKVVLLQDMGDIHPRFSVVCECETLIVDRCNKNFVYYWLGNQFRKTEETFPKVKNIYLGSHPCEPGTLQRLDRLPNTVTHLREDWYLHYKKRWLNYDVDSPVVMISNTDYDKMLSSLELTEEIVSSKQ